ncbi:Phenylpyruvate tautomerase [Bertholletia excelsa]
MPCLNLFTNVRVDAALAFAIIKEAIKAVTMVLGKPESYIMIVVNGLVPTTFGGIEEPAAYGELVSIRGLNLEANAKMSAAIADILQSKLSINKSWYYIKIYDVKNDYFGFNGSLVPLELVQGSKVI